MKTPVLMKVPWRSWAQGRSWSRLSGTHSSTTSLQHLGVEGPAGFAFRRSTDPVCCSLQKCTGRGGGGVPSKVVTLIFYLHNSQNTLLCWSTVQGTLQFALGRTRDHISPTPTPPPPAGASLSLSERLPRPSLLLPVPPHPSAPTAALILLSCL